MTPEKIMTALSEAEILSEMAIKAKNDIERTLQDMEAYRGATIDFMMTCDPENIDFIKCMAQKTPRLKYIKRGNKEEA